MRHPKIPQPQENENEKRESTLSSPPPTDVSFAEEVIRYTIPDSMLDQDAVKIVRRLSRFGYQAYFVGGCIRDILFGKQPKDFDIATSARPSEIKRLFRNCRLIGRRFRLAHLLFKRGKVIEVATFRRSPTEKDDISGVHAAENLFGGAADDAVRRDFTINALMYDYRKREIYDYVGGYDDIQAGVLRTIGVPDRRLPEDPVRIIRAIKFSVKLGLAVEPQLAESMKRHAKLINDCAPARLVEEMLKILRSGASARCFYMMKDVGVLSELMSGLFRKAARSPEPRSTWKILERMDEKILAGDEISDSTMIAALIYPFCRTFLDKGGDVAKRLEVELSKLLAPMKFTKRHMMHVRQIVLAQRRLAGAPVTNRLRRMMERDYAAHALDLKELISETKEDEEILGEWLKVFAERKIDNRRRPPNRDERKRSSKRRSNGKSAGKPERSPGKPRQGSPRKSEKKKQNQKKVGNKFED
ncbi:MAG: polynucleotide adenylyltransferase PcnB [Proteobacteria bacterium]|nr:polynucleotide adenylyltransferase PcnB [Pseudomonadota bacterium]